jgi:hypothetical protein
LILRAPPIFKEKKVFLLGSALTRGRRQLFFARPAREEGFKGRNPAPSSPLIFLFGKFQNAKNRDKMN